MCASFATMSCATAEPCYELEGADLYCILVIFLVVTYPASLYPACKILDVKD